MKKRETLKFLYIFSVIPLFIVPFVTNLENLVSGLSNIIHTSDVLITDYIAVGGMGATLFNVSIVTLMSVMLIQFSKAKINGTAIASVFLMASFSFFGKNFLNVIPIILGSALYAYLKKIPFRDVVNTALLATSFSPIFMELLMFGTYPLIARFAVAFVVSVSAGYFIIPVSRHLFQVHEGFNLYNTGFSIGILATLYVSLMKSYGYEPKVRTILAEGYTPYLTGVLVALFLILAISALILDSRVLSKYFRLIRESGYNDHDYLEKFGLSTVLFNMSINGFISLAYVLFIAKGELNGPIVGGILTVVGFSGLGKHILNIIPIFIGVVLGGMTKTWTLDQPSILFAALFGTALAPISGHYGPVWGIIASFINSSVVLNSGQLHSGLNLYNTGFSVGIVAAVMLPIIRTVTPISYKRQRRIDS